MDVIGKMKPIEIGNVDFSVEDLKESLSEFAELFRQRPILDNAGGMEAPQVFGAWFMLKHLKPKCIIESGVWYGQGTWFFEQAAPDASIICIEPSPDRIKYKSPRAQYLPHDFSVYDWSPLPHSETVCFFDDHQNAMERLSVATKWGFQHLIFEDNYPRSQGDCVSLKTVLENAGDEAETARKFLDVYYEFPPVVKGDKTRWGDVWTDDEYPTKPPLLEEKSTSMEDFFEGYENYTWICYAKLKESPSL